MRACALKAYLQIDLGLKESKAGTVVSVWIDVCQHHSEERGCLPVPGQLPASRLAELRRHSKKDNHGQSVAAAAVGNILWCSTEMCRFSSFHLIAWETARWGCLSEIWFFLSKLSCPDLEFSRGKVRFFKPPWDRAMLQYCPKAEQRQEVLF